MCDDDVTHPYIYNNNNSYCQAAQFMYGLDLWGPAYSPLGPVLILHAPHIISFMTS
jgi:hypothetical protein